jgi:hypothetical protein
VAHDAHGVLAIGIGFAAPEQADDIAGPVGPDLIAMALQFFQADRPDFVLLTTGPARHEQAAQ